MNRRGEWLAWVLLAVFPLNGMPLDRLFVIFAGVEQCSHHGSACRCQSHCRRETKPAASKSDAAPPACHRTAGPGKNAAAEVPAVGDHPGESEHDPSNRCAMNRCGTPGDEQAPPALAAFLATAPIAGFAPALSKDRPAPLSSRPPACQRGSPPVPPPEAC